MYVSHTSYYNIILKEMVKIKQEYKTKEGYKIEIMEKIIINKRAKYKIKLLDTYMYECVCDLKEIKNGSIKNPYHPSVHGIGYIGVGDYKVRVNGIINKEYECWRNMLKRAYDTKYHIAYPTYKNVTVCKEWLNFQTFAKFYNEKYPKNIKGITFEIDKDVLQNNVENKIYSPETVIFLPSNVNSFLTNIQKNTSGYTGVSFCKTNNKYKTQISNFGNSSIIHLGYFQNPQDASTHYKKARAKQSEKVREYLRSLNYLPEEIIQHIK